MKCLILFPGKIKKKKIKMSSTENFVQSAKYKEFLSHLLNRYSIGSWFSICPFTIHLFVCLSIFMSVSICVQVHFYINITPTVISSDIYSLSNMETRLSWVCDQVTSLIPAESSNILSLRLIMKYFLRSLYPFH